jgi:hypothetical protein
MLRILLITLLIVAICIFLLGIKVLFVKGGKLFFAQRNQIRTCRFVTFYEVKE